MFILKLFKWTSIILHTWTVIAAFVIKGFWGGILTLFLPVIAEIYWFFQMLSHGHGFMSVSGFLMPYWL